MSVTRVRRVVGLCGYATSGKDTAALTLDKLGWAQLGFADRVKEGALALNPIVGYRRSGFLWQRVEPQRLAAVVARVGWTKAKQIPEVRRTLQRYGTEAGREIFGWDCWIKIAAGQIERLLNSKAGVCVTDVRFENEAQLIREQFHGRVFEVRRPGLAGNREHRSEHLDFLTDGVIVNEGTRADLQRKLLLAMHHGGYAVL